MRGPDLGIRAIPAAPVATAVGVVPEGLADAFWALTAAGMPARPPDVVSPTVLALLTGDVLSRAIDTLLPPGLIHQTRFASYDLRVDATLYPGADLVHEVRCIAVGQVRTGVRLTMEVVTTGPGGVLGRQQLGVHVPGVHNAHELRGANRLPAAEPIANGTEIAVPIAPDMPRRYAALTGERAPVHVDLDAARAIGYDGLLVQGTALLALSGAAVLAAAGRDDPRDLARVRLRLATPVIAPTTLVVRVARVAGGHRFEADTDATRAIRDGFVELRAPFADNP